MKREAFKPGQVAYEVSLEKGVLLTKLRPTDCEIYTVLGQANAYTFDGRILEDGKLPSLYHANEDNYKKLCDFFGQDAVPKLPLSRREVIEILVEKEPHICKVSQNNLFGLSNGFDLIVSVDDEGYHGARGTWSLAIAVDSRAKEITELPEKQK